MAIFPLAGLAAGALFKKKKKKKDTEPTSEKIKKNVTEFLTKKQDIPVKELAGALTFGVPGAIIAKATPSVVKNPQARGGLIGEGIRLIPGGLARQAISTGLEFGAPTGTQIVPQTELQKALIGEAPITRLSDKKVTQSLQRAAEKAGADPKMAQQLALGSALFGGFAVESPFGVGPKAAAKGAKGVAKGAAKTAPVKDIGEKILGQAAKKEVTELPGNIRVDKFKLPNEDKGALEQIIKENSGFAEQRRGVMSFEDTQRLADEIISPNTKLKKGKALNAEELTALGNTVAGLQTKVSDLAGAIRAGDSTPVKKAELELAKQELTYALSSLSGARAEAGRALSSIRMLQKAKATNDVDLLQKAVKLSEGEANVDDVARRLVELGDDNLGKIKYIQSLSRPGLGKKAEELWINSILSSPKTHAVNITSNAIRALFEVPTRAVQAGFELAKGGKRGVFFREIPHQVVGALEGINEGVRKAAFTMKNGISVEDVTKLETGFAPAIKGVKGEIIRTPGRMLAAADDFFKTVAGTAEMRALAYRQARREGLKGKKAIEKMHELIANPSKELLDEVDLRKLEVTFQEPLGKAGKAISQLRTKAPGARFIIPFIKTPTNIFKQAVKASPAGFANVLRKAATKGEYKGLADTQLTRDLAQATLGSALALPIMMGALEGKITGSVPSNPTERRRFFDIEKKQPFSVKIGDQWVSYGRIEPFAMIIGSVVDMTQIDDDKQLADKAAEVSFLIGKNLEDKTFFSGISDFLNALSDPERYGEKWAGRVASGFVPFSGAARFTAQAIDPVIRDPQNVVQNVQAGLPGLSKKVPALRDIFGQNIERSLSSRLTPFAITPAEQDAVRKTLDESKINISVPSKSVGGVQLTDKEHSDFKTITGRTTFKVLASVVESPEWKLMNNAQREKTVRQIQDRVNERVKNRMFPIKMRAGDIKRKLKERGLTEAQAKKKTQEIIEKLEAKINTQ